VKVINTFIPAHYFNSTKRLPPPNFYRMKSNWTKFLGHGHMVNKEWRTDNGNPLSNMRKSVRSCLAARERSRGFTSPDVWFFGDSRVRHLYSSAVSLAQLLPKPIDVKKQTNHSVHVSNDTVMRYICDNFISESFGNHLRTFIRGTEPRIPEFVFVSVAQWFMSSTKWKLQLDVHSPETAKAFYTKTLKKLKPLMEEVISLRKTKFIWILQDYVNDKILQRAGYIYNNNKITVEYNAIAESIFSNSSVHVMKSAREITHALNDFRDGLHVGVKSTNAKANLLLNIICYDSIDNAKDSPS